MKIVALDGHTLADDTSWDALLPLGKVEIHDRNSTTQVAERAVNASVLITNKARGAADECGERRDRTIESAVNSMPGRSVRNP